MTTVPKPPRRSRFSVPLWLVGLAAALALMVAVADFGWDAPLPLMLVAFVVILGVAALGALSTALHGRSEGRSWPRAIGSGLADGLRLLRDLF
jgi:hypothetical protein